MFGEPLSVAHKLVGGPLIIELGLVDGAGVRSGRPAGSSSVTLNRRPSRVWTIRRAAVRQPAGPAGAWKLARIML